MRRDVTRGDSGLTVDGALGNTVTLVQPRDGYRFSVDAVLLARFAAESRVSTVLDIGCGCGVVGLCILALGGAEQLVGVDLQEQMVACADRSAERSSLATRATFYSLDYRQLGEIAKPGSFPLVVTNPPYRPAATGRVSPNRSVALARHELSGDVEQLAHAAARALEAGGRFCAVYPAERLVSLMDACRRAGLEPRILRCVHPRREDKAGLVLLACRKGRAKGLEIRPPLILHGDAEKYSAEATSLLGPP